MFGYYGGYGGYGYGGDGGREASNGVTYGGFAEVSQVTKIIWKFTLAAGKSSHHYYLYYYF